MRWYGLPSEKNREKVWFVVQEDLRIMIDRMVSIESPVVRFADPEDPNVTDGG